MFPFPQPLLRCLLVSVALSFFGLLLFCMPIHAEDRFAKAVSIAAKNQPLSFVLKEITQATGYTFIYDPTWSDIGVTVNAKNLPIDKVLRKMLADYNSAIQYHENGRVIINIYENSDSNPAHVQAPFGKPDVEDMYKNISTIDVRKESAASESTGDSDTTEVDSSEESDENEEDDEEKEEDPTPEDKQEDQEDLEPDEQEKETDNSEESIPDNADTLNSENE